MKKMVIQITSGKGPAECCRVVACVKSMMLKEGKQKNIQLCLARLEAKVLLWQTEQLISHQQNRWQEHNALERGNPVKIIKAGLC